MHIYPGITPDNVWGIEFDVLQDLIAAAEPLMKSRQSLI